MLYVHFWLKVQEHNAKIKDFSKQNIIDEG